MLGRFTQRKEFGNISKMTIIPIHCSSPGFGLGDEWSLNIVIVTLTIKLEGENNLAPKPKLCVILNQHANFARYLKSFSSSSRTMTEKADLKYTANSQLEHLHARYTGTLHPDVTKHEWVVHQHRDTTASILGHPMLHSYISLADGECKARTKMDMLDRMLQPCGPPPHQED